MNKVYLLIIISLAATIFSLTSCRVMDFTIISSKNVTIDLKKDSPRVKGGGLSIKGALDKAIESAGPGYDALIDGVVYHRMFFGYRVKGTPIKTSELKYDAITNTSDIPKIKKQKNNSTENKENLVNSEIQIYKVTSEFLNVRSGAGVAYELLFKINKGSPVELIEKVNTDWWKIKYNDKIGFVSHKYLSK